MGLDTQVVDAEQLIVKHLDLWTSAQTAKSTAGRGSNNKIELTGIKKLRELILELAVRGKLVPQDPNDEPASELIKRIAAEKELLAKAGTIKKQSLAIKPLESDIPFDLPSTWQWVNIDSIGYDFGQKTPTSDFTYIDVGSIDNDKGVVLNPKILSADEAPSRARKLVKKGSIVYSTVRPYLKNIAVIESEYVPEAIASTAFAIIHPAVEMASQFFACYLRSPSFVSYVESVQTGIAYPAINDKQFFSGVTPLPPLAEQYRIVSKVEELMALCDQLEQQSYQSIDAHNQLVDTLLQTLVDSANADELASNWQRLSEHFDTLFTTEYSIDALKQTILQLAVMGKLVKQDPTDEPASELLKRIAKEKEALVKAGKIKKQKPLPPITDNEKPFELPKGWEWCRLPDLGELSRGKSKHRPRNDPRLFKDGIYPLVQTGDVARADKLITSYASTYNDFGLAQSRLWPIGTLCITIAANIADTGILGIEACFPDSVVGYLPYSQNMPVEYFDYFIKVTKDDLERFAPSTAQKNINLEILGDLLVPCPPEDEIRRIVSKVEDLFNLCDNAKSKILESNNTQAVLAEALVEQNV